MLKADSLVRSYGDFRAVDDVSFTIESGQIVGLLGHNGAGKTTIMKMLTGYLEPDSGSVSLDGTPIEDDLNQFQSSLGYLPESLPVYQEMSVLDYLDYSADLKGIAGDDKLSEVKRVIHETGIQEKLESPISELSRGYKQRVGVAQAILGKPKLLILDEPTNGLDPSQTEQMRKLIRDISKKATVILSTHIMQEVDALCDRVLILKSGRLAVDADLEELRKGREVLLATDLPAGKLAPVFQEMKEIESSQEEVSLPPDRPDDYYLYRLTLDSEASRHLVGATLIAKVVEAGGRVFELKLVSRDLEALVRQVGAAEEKEVAGV
ncbi:MAG TPA: ABC transporter ATP-binding protein [Phycisphaerales bacterium]|nr:ABC transporter ATP-binding protein [Phycisphaerales bacterium]